MDIQHRGEARFSSNTQHAARDRESTQLRKAKLSLSVTVVEMFFLHIFFTAFICLRAFKYFYILYIFL